MFNRLLGCVLMSCAVLAQAQATANSDELMNVNSNNPDFTISVPANPTTGFQWTVIDYDKALLNLTHSQYVKPNSKLIGAGGVMKFTFDRNSGVAYPASTEITLKYARPWQANSATIKHVRINFMSFE